MAVLGYGLLGPVEVRADDRAVELTSASQRLVLAMLLLVASQLVPADQLMDQLWGWAPPRDPPAALRTQISRLRPARARPGLRQPGHSRWRVPAEPSATPAGRGPVRGCSAAATQAAA